MDMMDLKECGDKIIEIPDKKEQKTVLYKDNELFLKYQEDWLLCQCKQESKDNISKSIRKKLSSYRQQDIKRGILDEKKIMNYKECINMLCNNNNAILKCHYCLCETKLVYNTKRDMKQWTLDRLDNDQGHNNNNVVICCLECNLKKRRINDEKFKFEKQFTLIKNI